MLPALAVLAAALCFSTTGTAQALAGIDASPLAVGAAPDDLLLHTCVSPSSRYAAFLIAPDAVSNPYDAYALPLPERVQTHIVDLGTGEEVSVLSGFDISWCQNAPRP